MAVQQKINESNSLCDDDCTTVQHISFSIHTLELFLFTTLTHCEHTKMNVKEKSGERRVNSRFTYSIALTENGHIFGGI